MLTILLAGPGGNWMGLLMVLVILVALLKGSTVLYTKLVAWFIHRKNRNKNIVERNLN